MLIKTEDMPRRGMTHLGEVQDNLVYALAAMRDPWLLECIAAQGNSMGLMDGAREWLARLLGQDWSILEKLSDEELVTATGWLRDKVLCMQGSLGGGSTNGSSAFYKIVPNAVVLNRAVSSVNGESISPLSDEEVEKITGYANLSQEDRLKMLKAIVARNSKEGKR
jgi:hypothetical protein